MAESRSFQMFAKLFRPPTAMPEDVRAEVSAMCLARQIEGLGKTRHMRRDVGIDCGCTNKPETSPSLKYL